MPALGMGVTRPRDIAQYRLISNVCEVSPGVCPIFYFGFTIWQASSLHESARFQFVIERSQSRSSVSEFYCRIL